MDDMKTCATCNNDFPGTKCEYTIGYTCYRPKEKIGTPERSHLGPTGTTGSLAGFDEVDAQLKANNMVNILVDGSSQGLVNLRGAITAAIMEAYRKGQKNAPTTGQVYSVVNCKKCLDTSNHDLDFLREIKRHLCEAANDITKYEYLQQMVDDRIDELESNIYPHNQQVA